MIPAAIVVSRQLNQERISFLTERSEKLILSNNQLRTDALRQEKASTDMVLHFQREIAEKDGKIAHLQAQLDSIVSNHKIELDTLMDANAAEMARLKEALEASIKENADNSVAFEHELEHLAVFRKEKDVHDQKISALEEKLVSEKAAYVQELEATEHKFLVEKFGLIRAHEELIRQIKEGSLEEAHKILHGQQKTILAENERLFRDLKCHINSSAEMEKERNLLAKEMVDLQRSLELMREKEVCYVQLGQTKTLEVKKLRSRIEELEETLRDASQNYTQSYSKIKTTLTKDLEESSLDAAGLRTLLKFKNKELKRMRALSATILSQRNDVETFFLEALQEVRAKANEEKKELSVGEKRLMISHMRKGTMRAASSIRVRKIVSGESDNMEVIFPKLTGVKATNLKYWENLSEEPINSEESFAAITWEEKEMVLRALFSRMNGKSKTLERLKTGAGDEASEEELQESVSSHELYSI